MIDFQTIMTYIKEILTMAVAKRYEMYLVSMALQLQWKMSEGKYAYTWNHKAARTKAIIFCPNEADRLAKTIDCYEIAFNNSSPE